MLSAAAPNAARPRRWPRPAFAGRPLHPPTFGGRAQRTIPLDVWIVVGLVIVAAAIRFVTLGTQSFWTDEALTAYETTLPFGSMIHMVARIETTPPLYFVLIWGWAKAFGTSAVALRSLSAIAGIALVPIGYVATKELFHKSQAGGQLGIQPRRFWPRLSHPAGVLVAAFVAVSPFMIWYSQEARSYILLATLTGGAFAFFVRSLRQPSRGNLAGWAICSALAVMTHFFAGFVIAPEGVWLLWKRRTRGVKIAVVVAAAAQLAMLPFAFIDTGHGVSWIARTPRSFRLGQAAIEFGVNTMFRSISWVHGLIGAGVLLAVATLLIAAFGDQVTRRGATIAGLIFAIGFVVPLLIGFLGQDYFLARNEIIVWLPLAAVFAGACVVPRARLAGGALAVALLAMFIGAQVTIQTNTGYQRPAWRTLAQKIGASRAQRLFMVASGSAADPIKWYLPGVDWVQAPDVPRTFTEVDVVGTHKTESIVQDGPVLSQYAREKDPDRRYGIAEPVHRAPRGSRIIRRFRFRGWIVASFKLDHPVRMDLAAAQALERRFFPVVPASVLLFWQRPAG
jgi:uncharacterized membrane protein